VSEENVKIARRNLEAWQRDFEGWLSTIDPNVVGSSIRSREHAGACEPLYAGCGRCRAAGLAGGRAVRGTRRSDQATHEGAGVERDPSNRDLRQLQRAPAVLGHGDQRPAGSRAGRQTIRA
jgi:hypothetical protein